MFNKTTLAVAMTALLSGLTFTASAADNQGSGKITFTGEVISSPCSIKPGDENQTIELGEVADSVLNSGKNALPVDVNIHLQDCVLSQTTGQSTTTINKVMAEALEKGGSTDKNYVDAEGKKGSYLQFANVFRLDGQPCPRCGTTIEKIRIAGRGTHLCPTCQVVK